MSDHPMTSEQPGRGTATDLDGPACCGRRHVLRAGGVAVASVAALAACSGGSDTAGSAPTSSGGSDGGSGSSGGDTVPVADVPVGGGTIDDGAKVVVTQPTEGSFKAFSAVCTHAGCLVGQITEGLIICPCHGSEFDIATGQVVQGPASSPLPEKTVTRKGGSLTVT